MNWERQCLLGWVWGGFFGNEKAQSEPSFSLTLFRLFNSNQSNLVLFTINPRGFYSKFTSFYTAILSGFGDSESSGTVSISECTSNHSNILTVLQWRELPPSHLQGWRINSRAMLQSLQWQNCVPTCQGLFLTSYLMYWQQGKIGVVCRTWHRLENSVKKQRKQTATQVAHAVAN